MQILLCQKDQENGRCVRYAQLPSWQSAFNSQDKWVWTNVSWYNHARPLVMMLPPSIIPSAMKTSCQQLKPLGLLCWGYWYVWRTGPLSFLMRSCGRILELLFWCTWRKQCFTIVLLAWLKKWNSCKVHGHCYSASDGVSSNFGAKDTKFCFAHSNDSIFDEVRDHLWCDADEFVSLCG